VARPRGGGADAASAPSERRVAALLRPGSHPAPSFADERPSSKRTGFGGGSFVTGPADSPPGDRSPDRSDRGGSLAVPTASLRRKLAAPCRPGAADLPDHPAPTFVATHDTQPWSPRPCGFRAPRLRGKCSEHLVWRVIHCGATRRGGVAARAGHSCLAFLLAAHVPGPRPGWFSRPGRRCFRIAGGVRGIRSTLRSVAPTRG